MCQDWFQRSESCKFLVEDKECSGQSKRFENVELQTLSDENASQALARVSKGLNVTSMAVYKRSKTTERIQKEG